MSNLKDVGAWTRAWVKGRLLTPALQRQRDRFLPPESEGHDAKYGLAIELQSSGWKGHNGNITGFMAYPYYLPRRNDGRHADQCEHRRVWQLVMFGSVIQTVAPNHPWPKPPQE